MKIFVDMHCA